MIVLEHTLKKTHTPQADKNCHSKFKYSGPKMHSPGISHNHARDFRPKLYKMYTAMGIGCHLRNIREVAVLSSRVRQQDAPHPQ
jgi:hypothetical protein